MFGGGTMPQKHQIYKKLPLENSVKPVAIRVVSAIVVFLTKYTPKDATGYNLELRTLTKQLVNYIYCNLNL
jgi:hypothetical protein